MIIPIESLLPEFPKVIVNSEGRRGVITGKPLQVQNIIQISPPQTSSHYRIFDERGSLLALAEKDPQQKLFKPFMVLCDQ
jgi:hypothetical protein